MIISLAIGIFVSVIGLYLAFRNVPFDELIAYLQSIRYVWGIPSMGIVVLCFVLRSWRWQIILKSSVNVDFFQAFHPLNIGFMLNCIFPGRVGEIARPIILHRKVGVPFSTGLATVAVERVFDLVFLFGFFLFTLATVKIDPNLSIPFGEYHLNKETLTMIGRGMAVMGAVLMVGIVFVSFELTRHIVNAMIMKSPALFFFIDSNQKIRLREKICVPLVGFVENFAKGFSLLKNMTTSSFCVVLSGAIWGLQALSYYVLSLGCPGIELTVIEMTAVMVFICFFIALPSVPGFWGLWEAGGVFALTLFGVSANHAAGYALTSHAIQMFPVIIIGTVSVFMYGVNIRRISGDVQAQPTGI